MFDVTKFNKGETKFSHKLPEGAPYKKLSDLGDGATFRVRGLFISDKGKFGPSPIVISDDMAVYLPAHLIDTVNSMMSETECVMAINAGAVGCKVYSYETNGKICYSVRWTNVQEEATMM